ncbi:MAG: DUF5596 domain-containing protein [Clostridia bacterium]|nr:DUF5596 domain-containing protein [Clostridia bacterium]
MKAEIKSFCTEYDYPPEAIESLLSDFATLKASEYYPLFKAYVDLYERDDISFQHSKALQATRLIAEKTNINHYTLDLLLYICMAKHCRELYDQAGIPVKIYHDSMLDLKWKMLECKKIFNIWGTFVGSWLDRFFELSRFALGRLQFEDDPSAEEYTKNGVKLGYGDWVINVHIPSSGKLLVDDCITSFRMAAEFYADRFPDGIAKFRCDSWLLAPNHKDYLSPDTNIRKFADLFDIAQEISCPNRDDWLRIFLTPYKGETETYSSETSLQRAYLKMLRDGNLPQRGLGYLFLKNGNIL